MEREGEIPLDVAGRSSDANTTVNGGGHRSAIRARRRVREGGGERVDIDGVFAYRRFSP